MCVAHGFAAVSWHSDSEHLLVWVKEMKLQSMQTGTSVQAQMARNAINQHSMHQPVWKQLIFTGFPILPSLTCLLCSAHLKRLPATFISTYR